MAVLVFKLWPALKLEAPLIACVAVVAMLRLAAALIAKLRFGFLHTYANKTAGVLLTLYPFVLALTSARWPLVVLVLVTGISALEELLMELTATGWNPNQTSILQRSKSLQDKAKSKSYQELLAVIVADIWSERFCSCPGRPHRRRKSTDRKRSNTASCVNSEQASATQALWQIREKATGVVPIAL